MRAATTSERWATGSVELAWCACESGSPRLLDRVRHALRVRHYSRRTERAYVAWIRRYILLPWLDDLVRATRPRRLPVVLSRDEVCAVLGRLDGTPRLMTALLYGTGMRLLECARLRIKDVDFAANQVMVRGGKGDRDRVTLLPASVRPALQRHLERVRAQHARDLAAGAGWVELPLALARKLPNAGREWPWQWVFPATRLYADPVSRQRRRHHLHETVLQRAVRDAVRAGRVKAADATTLMYYRWDRDECRYRRYRPKASSLVDA